MSQPRPEKVKKIEGRAGASSIRRPTRVEQKPRIVSSIERILKEKGQNYEVVHEKRKIGTELKWVWVIRVTEGEKTNDEWIIKPDGKGGGQVTHRTPPVNGQAYLPSPLAKYEDKVRPKPSDGFDNGYVSLSKDDKGATWKLFTEGNLNEDKDTLAYRRPNGDLYSPRPGKMTNGKAYIRDNDLSEVYVLSTDPKGAKFRWVLKKKVGKDSDGNPRYEVVKSFKNTREVRRYFNDKTSPMWPVRLKTISDAMLEARAKGYKGGFRFTIGNKSELEKLLEEELIAAANGGKKKNLGSLLKAHLAGEIDLDIDELLIVAGYENSKVTKTLMEKCLAGTQKTLDKMRELAGLDETEAGKKGGGKGGKKAKSKIAKAEEKAGKLWGNDEDKEKKNKGKGGKATAKGGGGAKRNKNKPYQFQTWQTDSQMWQSMLASVIRIKDDNSKMLSTGLLKLDQASSYGRQRTV